MTPRMNLELAYEEILKETKRIMDMPEKGFEMCNPNCIPCMAAHAKGIVDKRFEVRMDSSDLMLGLRGIPTMVTDFAMLRVIRELES